MNDETGDTSTPTTTTTILFRFVFVFVFVFVIMWFCPLDGTLLQVQHVHAFGDEASGNYFYCSTCPYRSSIQTLRTTKTIIPTSKRKTVDDILGGAKAFENVDRTKATCPECNHQEAYFLQMQIRSADEPMSIFYKCCQCSHQWNDK